MTARLRPHDHSSPPNYHSPPFPRPFVPTPMTIRPRPHIKLQTPTYPDKTTNTSGQKRWTTKVIHPTRPFASSFTTIHIASLDRSYHPLRPLASHFATIRKLTHDIPSTVLCQHRALTAEIVEKNSNMLLALDTCSGPQRTLIHDSTTRRSELLRRRSREPMRRRRREQTRKKELTRRREQTKSNYGSFLYYSSARGHKDEEKSTDEEQLRLGLALDVVLHPKLFAIEDGVGELADPVAEDEEAGIAREHQV